MCICLIHIVIILLFAGHCIAKTDECPCSNMMSEFNYYECGSDKGCFRCLNYNETISKEAVCDGAMNCRDLSDEMLCSRRLRRSRSATNHSERCEDMPNLTSSVNTSENCDYHIYFVGNHSVPVCGDRRNNDTTCSTFSTSLGKSYWRICNCSTARCHVDDDDRDRESNDYKKTIDDLIFLVRIGLLIGIISILGNVTVIVVTVRTLYKRRHRFSSKQRLTKYFFLSLSFSDMLVGIYTCSISLATLVNRCLLDYDVCNILGAFSMVGSEQSVFTMLLIAISRACGIIRPFSRTPLKLFMISLVVCWILSVLIAVVPLMNAFKDVFVEGMQQQEAPVLKWVHYSDVKCFNNFLERYSKRNENARPSGHWEKLESLAKELFNITLTPYAGFYKRRDRCLPNLFPKSGQSFIWYYFAIYLLNVVCFASMAVCYYVLYKYRKQSDVDQDVKNLEAEAESQRLKRKITVILVTDFVCWFPICALGIINLIYMQYHPDATAKNGKGHKASDLFNENAANLVVTFVLLPINSAMNPFLYSSAPEYVHRKCISVYKSMKDKCISGPSTISEVSSPERTYAATENALMTVVSVSCDEQVDESCSKDFAESQF